MLSELGLSAISGTLSFGCGIKVFPYKWNPQTFKLTLPNSKWHIFWYNVHRTYMFIFWNVIILRFVINPNSLEVPPQIRVLHLVWIVGYTLTLICFLQFELKHKEILVFANSLFLYILQQRDARIERKKKPGNKVDHGSTTNANDDENSYSDITNYVLMSTILLFVNPPCHAAAVIHTPCAPNFVSSLMFPCTHTLENTGYFYEKIPWIFAENMVITNFLFTWSFNWTMIFLGLAWIREEMRRLKLEINQLYKSKDTAINELKEANSYRIIQCRMKCINESFKYYLAWFPPILLGIMSLLLYGTIKLWYIPFLSYIIFPTCGFRCLFESMTPLSISGDVNSASIEFLNQWKSTISKNRNRFEEKEMRRIYKSSPKIECTAGSMYTFEKTIFLVTISNCAQITLNLLLLWP